MEMNKKRMGKHAERIQRFVYKKINKQLISVAGSVLIVLGSYAIVPLQVLATETTTEEAAQVQPSNGVLPTVASSELGAETPPTTANQEGAAQETPPTTTDDAKAPKETESKAADEAEISEETDQQADTAKTRAQPQPQSDAADEGWEYENRGTYVEITEYTGDVVNITIPAKIEGLPVEINLGTVLKEKMANPQDIPTETFKIETASEGGTPVKLVGTFEYLFACVYDPTLVEVNNTLISADFGNADCSEIDNMSSMFLFCTQLQKLDLSGWNTSQVQDMSRMFDHCRKLQDLNLSGWNTSQVRDMSRMFDGNDNLSTLTLSSDFEFKGNTDLRGLPNDSGDTTYRWVKDDVAAMYDSTAAFIAAHNNLTETATNHTYKIKALDNPTAEGWGFVDKGTYMEITSYNGDPTNITVPAKIYGKPVEINLGTVLKEKMANWDAAPTETFKIETAGEEETPVKLVGTFKDLFARPSGGGGYTPNITLTSVDFENADCSEIENMSSMFSYCTQLEDLNLSGWDTSQVQDMGAMFIRCSQLKDLNLSGWNTSQVQDMSFMFLECSQLKDLNLSGWNTSQVQDMSLMFRNCSQLKELDLSGWNTSQVQDMLWMFNASDNLSTLTLSSDFEFKDNTGLRGLPNDSGDTTYRWVKDDFAAMYDSTTAFIAAHNDLTETATNHTYKIKTLDNPTAEGWGFDDKGTYMEITSYNGDPTNITVPAKIYGKPVEINLGTVLKEKMANMTEAVTETFKIESAGEGETPVKLVGTFEYLFARQTSWGTEENSTLTSVDFGNADCSEIEDMSSVFERCIALEKLDLSGWNTSRVQDMRSMFSGCSELKDLNLSGWDTSKVQDMRSMFSECSELKDLNLSGWDTSKVQDMSYMFSGCSELKDLNLSGWDTSKVENMSSMFNWCSELEDLNLSGWNTSQVQNMSYMFSGCSELKDLNLSGWDTSQVQIMFAMFRGCSQLQDLNLSGWNTSNVLDMGGMFYGSDNLSKLTLSSDFEFQSGHSLRGLPANSGKTTYHWVKDEYKADYDSTADFTTAHNNLTGASKNHVYTIQKKHEVSFDLNGGSGNTPDTQYIFEGNSADKPDYKGTKEDLIFDGWTLNGNRFTFDTPITESVELVASWRKARYTIKFDANGGEGTMSDQDLTVDEEQQLPANQFTRKGYDFDGWNKESNGGGDSYSDKESVKNLSKTDGAQVKLYAQWNPITYTVTFDTKDGKPTTSKNYTIEKGIDSFGTPTRSGYTFDGWYDGKEKVTIIKEGETGNRTLIAKWTPVTYKVTFDSAGGNAIDPMSYTIEEKISSLPTPTRKGYKFMGWFEGETKVTELPKGTIGDKTLTAKWEKIKTTEVIEEILKEENQKNRKEQDYTEDSWKNYQEAKKAAEDLLKEVNPDPLKAEQVLAKLQAAIKGLTLKDATAPTPVGTTNIPVSKKVYPTAQAKQYPRTNMITTVWPGFIGTGLVAAVIALVKKNKK